MAYVIMIKNVIFLVKLQTYSSGGFKATSTVTLMINNIFERAGNGMHVVHAVFKTGMASSIPGHLC